MEELTFEELKNSNDFQIVKEQILQVSDGVCAFYGHGRIRDLKTGKEAYINENLLDVLFPLFDKYTETQMKRNGVWELSQEQDKISFQEEIFQKSKEICQDLSNMVDKFGSVDTKEFAMMWDNFKEKYPRLVDKLWEK